MDKKKEEQQRNEQTEAIKNILESHAKLARAAASPEAPAAAMPAATATESAAEAAIPEMAAAPEAAATIPAAVGAGEAAAGGGMLAGLGSAALAAAPIAALAATAGYAYSTITNTGGGVVAGQQAPGATGGISGAEGGGGHADESHELLRTIGGHLQTMVTAGINIKNQAPEQLAGSVAGQA